MALYRKRLLTPTIPAALEVLWGDEVAEVRSIVEIDETVGAIQARLDAYPANDLYERTKLADGDWILATYTSLTEKQCVECSDGTATLVSGVLTMNNSELIEE